MRGTEIIETIMEIGEAYRFERNHALQVTRIALRLFDELQPLHGMGNTEKIWLRAAAMLHDIGKFQDPKDHHKVAQEIIISSSKLPFRTEERVIIGLIARYHRGSLPQADHKYFADLDAEGRRYVRKLASLLRLADGLDKGHSDLVEALQCKIRRRRVHIQLVSREPLNVGSALSKADLLESVFQKKALLRATVAKTTRDARPRAGKLQSYRDSTLDFGVGLAYAEAN